MQETLFICTSATLSAKVPATARVAQVTPDGVTTLYVGELYEVRRGSPDALIYYYLGGQRVAMRDADDNVAWLHGDHPTLR